MASYKQPCLHCGALVDRDVRLCPHCGSRSPFGYLCPTCNHAIDKTQRLCPGCGRPLRVTCPGCRQETFVQDTCEHCNASLMVYCQNRRCGQPQFFLNDKCTCCGKRMT